MHSEMRICMTEIVARTTKRVKSLPEVASGILWYNFAEREALQIPNDASNGASCQTHDNKR